MRKRAIRWMIYLVLTLAAILLEVFAGVKYRVNGWLLLGLVTCSLLPLIVFAVSPYVTPGWIRQIRRYGAKASADVLKGDPLDGMGYRGDDMWIDIPVEVHPNNEEPFRAFMKIRLSQAALGLPLHGKRVYVRYDPKDKNRVVLDGELVHLPGKRARV